MGECSYSAQSQKPGLMDESGIRLCKTSPKFLESNATSHTWVFSAIAELIDNAYDPDVQAKQIWIDKKEINGQHCLCIVDDGNGLSEEQLYRMLSFGYSDKNDAQHAYKAIGRYGNGFKSGSMRLGKDAMVFTKQKNTLSVGLLSQTFHERIKADTVFIPIVTFDRTTLQLAEPIAQNQSNLNAILQHSIFSTADDLIDFLTVVPDFNPSLECGTKILIWNLRELAHGMPELMFRQDIQDIVYNDPNDVSGLNVARCGADLLDYEHSLRKYCSILYLRPRMQIFLLNGKVRSRLVAKDLKKTVVETYTMKGQPSLVITFGFNPTNNHTDSGTDFGILLYQRNRLIKPYEKVGYQKAGTGGQGVVGVVEADFLTPNHNKQNFNADEKYHRVINALAKKLNEYWDAKTATNIVLQGASAPLIEPDCLWVQCDQCLKWRRLPEGTTDDELQTPWYCCMHPDEKVSTVGCHAPEDKLDQGEIDFSERPVYREEKKKALINRKRKTSVVNRSRRWTGGAGVESDEEEEYHPERHEKRRRTLETSQDRVNENRSTVMSDVRRKIEQLNHHAQSLLAETPVVVADIADSLHQQRHREKNDDENRTVQCVRCHQWKKLPTAVRADMVNEWECKMHPDQSQRKCQSTGSDASNQSEGSLPATIPKNAAGRSSAPAETNVQERNPVITLDPSSDEADTGDDNQEDVKAMQHDLDNLAQVMNTVAVRLVKAETATITTQTDATTTADAGTNTVKIECSECEQLRRRLECQQNQNGQFRVQVAQLLNILLENANVQPQHAMETVASLIAKGIQNGHDNSNGSG